MRRAAERRLSGRMAALVFYFRPRARFPYRAAWDRSVAGGRVSCTCDSIQCTTLASRRRYARLSAYSRSGEFPCGQICLTIAGDDEHHHYRENAWSPLVLSSPLRPGWLNPWFRRRHWPPSQNVRWDGREASSVAGTPATAFPPPGQPDLMTALHAYHEIEAVAVSRTDLSPSANMPSGAISVRGCSDKVVVFCAFRAGLSWHHPVRVTMPRRLGWSISFASVNDAFRRHDEHHGSRSGPGLTHFMDAPPACLTRTTIPSAREEEWLPAGAIIHGELEPLR